MAYCEECDSNHYGPACKDIPAPRKKYVIDGGEDATYAVAVFSSSAVKDAGLNLEDTEELVSRLTGWGPFYRGPGRAFGTTPHVRIGKRNIVIKQFTALDI